MKLVSTEDIDRYVITRDEHQHFDHILVIINWDTGEVIIKAETTTLKVDKD